MNNTSQNSVSLSEASEKLAQALTHLDSALDPVLTRLQHAESRVSETEGFDEDRARLARELDQATARAQAAESRLSAREDEFAALSRETRSELDQTITTLRDALDEGR